MEYYFHSEPKIIEQILDVLAIIGNFNVPSLVQEQFFLKFLNYFYFYQFNKNPVEDKENIKYFFDKLHKDFKTHDYEEYESHFLNCVLSKFQNI